MILFLSLILLTIIKIKIIITQIILFVIWILSIIRKIKIKIKILFLILIFLIIIKIKIIITQIIFLILIIIFFKFSNYFNNNNNNNIYNTNDNIFNIHTINYNKNNNIYNINSYINNFKDYYNTNNNIFYINTLSYNKNNIIYNTNNIIFELNTFSTWGWAWTCPNPTCFGVWHGSVHAHLFLSVMWRWGNHSQSGFLPRPKRQVALVSALRPGAALAPGGTRVYPSPPTLSLQLFVSRAELPLNCSNL